MDAPGEEADEVLLLVVLDVERHVLEALGEARAHGEGLLRIADADAVGRVSRPFAGGKGKQTDMCVMPRLSRVGSDLEATKGPSSRPGRISWHSRRISYLRTGVGERMPAIPAA